MEEKMADKNTQERKRAKGNKRFLPTGTIHIKTKVNSNTILKVINS